MKIVKHLSIIQGNLNSDSLQELDNMQEGDFFIIKCKGEMHGIFDRYTIEDEEIKWNDIESIYLIKIEEIDPENLINSILTEQDIEDFLFKYFGIPK